MRWLKDLEKNIMFNHVQGDSKRKLLKRLRFNRFILNRGFL